MVALVAPVAPVAAGTGSPDRGDCDVVAGRFGTDVWSDWWLLEPPQPTAASNEIPMATTTTGLRIDPAPLR
ncbi:hypothetical protein Mkiyose1665_05390 [Mycobacterium kiyosense]|uniref:Uncharacterized protein n=1 Tax=Mycobacterium kiyosense TaxID=2871094 RepID=A0A9P3UXI2_9MYCO|nr:hypothetical protein IWGMT90018_31000 [Mycobacterium kiyosense]BDE14088.1 hypothetical protein MKCMC460_29480 [Mycobacterium sp. 20KCMC460]GLB81155.1 hypothetical protein SRL2020028_04110 [Mycobacterium kiyosense]GLB88186.1 hypothetical protein SRL2020130_10030 [Mycobacterium kiyosense]GLB94492.1 hypothetical protein SRL2020226_12680 [Mycobacterium kiyosense]